jgi:DnaK suppressor protein
MNDAEIEAFRQTLLQLRSELHALQTIAKDATQTVELDQASVGRLSRMDALQAQEMALETQRRRQYQLQKIEGALRRIESGDYGDCFVCGRAIDVRRLAVDPTHTRCAQCVD